MSLNEFSPEEIKNLEIARDIIMSAKDIRRIMFGEFSKLRIKKVNEDEALSKESTETISINVIQDFVRKCVEKNINMSFDGIGWENDIEKDEQVISIYQNKEKSFPEIVKELIKNTKIDLREVASHFYFKSQHSLEEIIGHIDANVIRHRIYDAPALFDTLESMFNDPHRLTSRSKNHN